MTDFRDLFNQRPLDAEVIASAAASMMQGRFYAHAFHLLHSALTCLDAHHNESLRLQYGLVHYVLGQATGKKSWHDKACAILEDCLKDFPKSTLANKFLGVVLVDSGKWREAFPLLKTSLDADPLQVDAWLAISWCHFAAGEYAEGWDAHERFLEERHQAVNGTFPYWKGEDVRFSAAGKGGIGDEIMFASMVPDAARRWSFELVCDPRLVNIFKRSFPNVEVIARSEGQPGRQVVIVDGVTNGGEVPKAACFTSSFGHLLRRKAADFPCVPYLIPDPERVEGYKKQLAALPGKKVGIAWAGGPALDWHRRSLEIEDIVRLCSLPDVSWVCLEYLSANEELAQLKERGVEVHDFPARLAGVDIDDTAALVMALDGVVTVQTAMAHLCGALGKRAHVLLPSVPRWWHGILGRRHPWYGSLVLHRQAHKHVAFSNELVADWPIDNVIRELSEDLCLSSR